MLFLSVRSVSTSIKENFEINGSLSDPKISTELKNLLERYAKMLGSTFENAVDLVTGVSDGLSSYKVCSVCPKLKNLMLNWLYMFLFVLYHVLSYKACFVYTISVINKNGVLSANIHM